MVHAKDARGDLRVLFVGNSLTYANEMPAIVAALADASGAERLAFESLAFPNVSLEDQWQRGDARRAIAARRWDFVVLQQGPSALDESRRLLLDYVRRFAGEIRASGAKPALYMVWPAESRARDFDRVIESYRLAAEEVGGVLLPVGRAWREAWKLDPAVPLYAEDRFHPSVEGSYLAALVIYRTLFQRSPLGLPEKLKLRSARLDRVELPKERARLLQTAASNAVPD